MKRQRNVNGNNNMNNNNITNKIKLASPKADEETIGKNNEGKRKIVAEIEAFEDRNKKKIKNKGEKKIVAEIEAFEDRYKEKKIKNFNGVPLSSSNINTSLKTLTGDTISDSCSNSLEEWEESWSWSREGIVDEQMSWGSTWSPIWDVEYLGEACGHMFSDIMWDDDLWNLKSTGNVPNP